MSSKKTNVDKKTMLLLIVIVVMTLLLIVENCVFLFYLFLRKNEDYNYTRSSWVNSYTLGGVKYKTEIAFNDGSFKYKTLKNDDLDFTINGKYTVDKDSIYIEYYNSDDNSLTTYSFKYEEDNDYLCFNHKSDCEEGSRFYRTDDERALKYVDLKYNNSEEKKEEKEEEEELSTPQYEKDVVPTFYVFYGQECPHCEELFEWINNWNYENEYQLVKYEVWHNDSNRELMNAVADYLGVEASGVPFIVIGNGTMKGFSKNLSPDQIKSLLDEAVKNSSEGTYYDVIKTVSK